MTKTFIAALASLLLLAAGCAKNTEADTTARTSDNTSQGGLSGAGSSASQTGSAMGGGPPSEYTGARTGTGTPSDVGTLSAGAASDGGTKLEGTGGSGEPARRDITLDDANLEGQSADAPGTGTGSETIDRDGQTTERRDRAGIGHSGKPLGDAGTHVFEQETSGRW